MSLNMILNVSSGSWKHLMVALAMGTLTLGYAMTLPDLEEVEIPEGYEYQGRVKFTTRRDPIAPLKAFASKGVPRNSSQPLYSILVLSSGHKFTKRLPEIPDDQLDKMRFDAVDPEMHLLQQAAARRARKLTTTSSSSPSSPSSGSSRTPAGASSSSSSSSSPTTQVSTVSPKTSATATTGSAEGKVSVEEVTSTASGSTNAVDTRTRVASATTYPYSAIGMLLGEEGTSNEYLQCTGALLDTGHILTAAHCVWNIEAASSADRTYVSTLNFYPGMNGGSLSSNTLGTYTWHSVKVLSQFTDQTSYNTEATNYDFALITLKSATNPLTGSFGLFRPPTSGTATITLNTAGYPGDKTPSYSMWSTSCSGNTFTYTSNLAASSDCETADCQNWVAHNCYSYNGQSGSPMWDSSTNIRAVLTGEAFIGWDGGSKDSIRRLVHASSNKAESCLTTALFRYLQVWMTHHSKIVSCHLATLSSNGATVSSGIATSIDAFTYNTIAEWFTEDNSTTSYVAVSVGATAWPYWAWIILAVGACILIFVVVSAVCACIRRSRSSSVSRPTSPGKGAQIGAGVPIGAYAGSRPPPGFPVGGQQPPNVANPAYPHHGGYPQPQYAGYPTGPMGVPPPGSARALPPGAAGPHSVTEPPTKSSQGSAGRQGSPRGKKGTPRGGRDALATV